MRRKGGGGAQTFPLRVSAFVKRRKRLKKKKNPRKQKGTKEIPEGEEGGTTPSEITQEKKEGGKGDPEDKTGTVGNVF